MNPQLIARFNELFQEWEEGTWFLSNPNAVNNHISCQEIIELGRQHKEEIVSLIFDKMDLAHWYFPLREILGKAPEIPLEFRGRIDKMNEIYLDWLRKQGF